MQNKENLSNRIFRGTSTVLFFSLLTSPLGYVLRIIYSNNLSIEMYGLFYALLAFFGILTTYKDLGFGYSVTYLVPKLIKQGDFEQSWMIYKYAQIIEVGTSIILTLLLVLIAPWLSINYFKVPEAQTLIYLFCIYFIANSFLEALYKMFTGLQQEKYYSSIQFSRLLLALIFSIFFIIFDYSNIIFFALSWALAHIICSIIYTYLLNKNSSFGEKRLVWDKKLFSTMLKFAIPTLITTSIYTFITFTDNFFLTLFKNVREVGIYNIIVPLISIPSIFLSPINNLLLPLVSHLMEGEKVKMSELLSNSIKIISFVGFYFSLFIMLFPSATTQLIFGVKWVGLIETPLRIMAFGAILALLSSYLTTITCGMGKIKERMRASLIIAVTNIIISVVLINLYGIIGVAIASTLIYLLSIILFIRIIRHEISIHLPVKLYTIMLLFSLSLYLLVQLSGFSPKGFIQFLITGIIYSLIILLLGITLGIFDYIISIIITTKGFISINNQYPFLLKILLKVSNLLKRYN
ncbi:MAG: oligosaccharide flippase family protein [Candidatus Daviesbacteria bacterium]|nr:oligosaccharide flippase family protein [Candidatus Daviesbacteria bacterium]